MRAALAMILNAQGDISVVAEVDRGDEVLAAATATNPNVALLDIEMPGGGGLVAARELHSKLPECHVLILTVFSRPGYLSRAIESGVHGFILKDSTPAQLADAVRRTARGERVVDPKLALLALREGASPLTSRERDVLALSVRGMEIDNIAIELNLSQGTVRNYLSWAIQKLGASNRVEAAAIAEEKGWL